MLAVSRHIVLRRIWKCWNTSTVCMWFCLLVYLCAVLAKCLSEFYAFIAKADCNV